MGLFLKWMELRESTSRKRRIKAALSGKQPPLPGSYAANPHTNVNAMSVADKTGLVKKYMHKCGCPKCGDKCPCGPDCICRKYQEDQSPDYSIDKWIDMAGDLGNELSVLKKGAEDQEDDLDKKIDSKKKDTEMKKKEIDKEDNKDNKDKEKEDKEEDNKDKDKEKEELWSKIKNHLKKNGEGSSKN